MGLYSKDQALKMLCPIMSRNESFHLCRADDCLAWRSSVIQDHTGEILDVKGYCGLAGRPEVLRSVMDK